MHEVSAIWQQIYAQVDHRKEIAVTVNGVEYYEGRILNTAPSVSGKLFDAPSVGNARSRTLTLNLMPYDEPQGHISPMSEIRLYVRLKSADGQSVSEWIPKGVFYADEVKRDSDTGATRITAFDAMMKMELKFGATHCRITFDDGFGLIQTFYREIGEATPTPETPSMEGYAFKGWTPTPTPTVTANATYTAQWDSATLQSIAIAAQPTKTTYSVGETLDYTGLVVTASYSDGATQTVTADCTFSPAANSTVSATGTITVTVSYQGKTAMFNVTGETGIVGDDWWTLFDNGLLYVYCIGDMPNYQLSDYSFMAYYYNYTYTSDNGYELLPFPITDHGDFTWSPEGSDVTNAPWGEYAHELGYYSYDTNSIEWFAMGELIITRPALINAVSISSSVTKIGNSAFAGVPMQANLVIPNSVTAIGNYAFYNAKGLTSVVIPSSVKHIGYYAFYQTDLREVTISRDCEFDETSFPDGCAINYYQGGAT